MFFVVNVLLFCEMIELLCNCCEVIFLEILIWVLFEGLFCLFCGIFDLDECWKWFCLLVLLCICREDFIFDLFVLLIFFYCNLVEFVNLIFFSFIFDVFERWWNKLLKVIIVVLLFVFIWDVNLLEEELEDRWFISVFVGLFLWFGRIFISFGWGLVKKVDLFFCLIIEGICGIFIVIWLRVDGWGFIVYDWVLVFLECWLFGIGDFIILEFWSK